MTPLLLLQLPHVVTREIMNQFELKERFLLSLCSPRAFRFVRYNQRRSEKWKLCLKYEDKKWIVCGGQLTGKRIVSMRNYANHQKKLEPIRIGSREGVIYPTSKGFEVVIGKNERTAFKLLVDYMWFLFYKLPTVIHTSPGNLWMVRMYRSPLDQIHIHSTNHPLNWEEIKKAFEGCQATVLRLDAEPEGFPEPVDFGSIKGIFVERRKILFTMELISLARSCQVIHATTVQLMDLNLFIKEWMQGNMKHNGRVFKIKPGMRIIRRRDGKVLVVELTERRLVVTVI
uniref:F-box domain-containing protein n=1 Tax=Caenorhabditis tropicalis TaxID=1561998 RepID=A0A1I7UZ80_9PELO